MKKDKFEDVKIKMVMKLKRLSRQEAVAEIRRMDSERKAVKAAGDAGGEPVDADNALVHGCDLFAGDMVSADEFFGN